MARIRKLSKEQLGALAILMLGTRGNVIGEAFRLFGYKFKDADFDRMEHECMVFECEECDVWKEVKEKSKNAKCLCQACEEDQDAVDHNEELDNS